MQLEVNPMPFTSSTASSQKSGAGVVPDQFPAGLRVLVVDDDPTCLRILEKMLRICLYEVTKCSRAEVALKLLRDNKDGFDVVISDVHMPDMDGFKLLEHVGLEMDLPVIMMSADDSKRVVMKGVTHGACDYLIKPVRMEALKNIWQHVIRRKKHEWDQDNDKDNKDFEQSGSVEDGDNRQQQKPPSDDVNNYSSNSTNEGSFKSSKKRKDIEDECEEKDDTSSKKQRVVWTTELHQQFVTAVNQLGIDKAVPKKILELMNVQGLTRENVASHLQKYRLYLRRLSGQHQNGIGSSFVGPTDGTFGPFDIQSLASSSQLPPQSQLLAQSQLPSQSISTLQSTPLVRANTYRSPVSVPLNDPRNIFSFETPKIRFVQGQQQQVQQQQQHNGIINNVNLLHGIPTNMNMHSTQINSQPRSQVFSNAVFAPNGNHRFTPAADFSRSQRTDLPRNMFSHVSNSEMNGSRGFVSAYDACNNMNQNNKTDDWGFQSVGSTAFEAPPHLSIQNGGLVDNSNIGQQQHIISSASDNILRIRDERSPDMGFQNGLFTDQDELLNTYIKENNQDLSFDGDFGLDAYPLDNLPV